MVDRLACPDCHAGLSPVEAGLTCGACGRFYPVADGVPILFSSESEMCVRSEEYGRWQRDTPKGTRKSGYRERRRLPKTGGGGLSTAAKQKFFEAVGEGVVLNIGSGERSIAVGRERWINLDIRPHSNVDVVGDGHFLPFADNSLDAVVSSSVFEHLRKPWIAAAEVARVLKPGGLMWCDVPFAYPIHGSPFDFFRYTPYGLASIFQELEVVDSGPNKGPIAAIQVIAERAAEALVPGPGGFALRWLTAWAIQPFKLLDPRLARRDPKAATSFFIVAQKA